MKKLLIILPLTLIILLAAGGAGFLIFSGVLADRAPPRVEVVRPRPGSRQAGSGELLIEGTVSDDSATFVEMTIRRELPPGLKIRF